eukprot:9690009-Lingulodinium_polyedra.AAC.1
MKYLDKDIAEKYDADSANLVPLPGMHGHVPPGPEPSTTTFLCQRPPRLSTSVETRTRPPPIRLQ